MKRKMYKSDIVIAPNDCPICGDAVQVWNRQDLTFGCGCIKPECSARVAPSIGEERNDAIKAWNEMCKKIKSGKFIP